MGKKLSISQSHLKHSLILRLQEENVGEANLLFGRALFEPYLTESGYPVALVVTVGQESN